MLHASVAAELQSIRPLLPWTPEPHSPDAPEAGELSPVQELPLKTMAVQPLSWLQDSN